jgi:hypothetical protein
MPDPGPTESPAHVDDKNGEQNPQPEAAPVTSGVTKISRTWTIRMVLTAAVLLGFGCWGLYDALIKYPDRGRRAAEYLEYQYLDEAQRSGSTGDLGVADPVERMALLRQQERESGKLNVTDHALLRWLEQLELVGQLTPEFTAIPRTGPDGARIDTAFERHGALKTKWDTAASGGSAPSPLSWFDIPSQWLFVVIGFGVGSWLTGLIIWVWSRKYTFDAEQLRLTIPGGAQLTPGDIEEFDKRKWDKLYIALKVRASHPQLGGKVLELDLMRFEPLEAWVLAMERAASPQTSGQPIA